MESALQLDIATGGSFTHKTTVEGEALLDRILENTPLLEPLWVEPELNHEEGHQFLRSSWALRQRIS
jgi:hypothetical protein